MSDVLGAADGSKLVDSDIKQGNFMPYYLEHLKKGSTKFTEGTIYPIFAFMFNHANTGTLNQYDLIQFDDVCDRMNRYCCTLWSDFYEETRYRPWLEINAAFFQYAFYHDYIYVHWNEEDEKYELYFKCASPKEDITEDLKESNKYINIQTNVTVLFSHPEEDLVRFTWNGRVENRFRAWFKLAYITEVKLAIFGNQCFLFNKKLIVKGENYHNVNAESLNALKKELVNLAPFINKTDRESLVEFILTPIVTGMDLDAYISAVYKWFDREISEFGRVANLNPKKERKTAGENYIAIDRQVDHLRSIQDQLDLMTLKMTERGWPDLVFKVNTEVGLGLIEEPEGDQQPKPSNV